MKMKAKALKELKKFKNNGFIDNKWRISEHILKLKGSIRYVEKGSKSLFSITDNNLKCLWQLVQTDYSVVHTFYSIMDFLYVLFLLGDFRETLVVEGKT